MICDDCHQPYADWFTDHPVWNRVMGGSDATDDPGGLLCMACFTRRADLTFGELLWRVVPVWRPVDAQPRQ